MYVIFLPWCFFEDAESVLYHTHTHTHIHPHIYFFFSSPKGTDETDTTSTFSIFMTSEGHQYVDEYKPTVRLKV